MKNLLKLIGIIALAAVIGFSIAACGSSGNPTGTGGTYTETYTETYNVTYDGSLDGVWEAGGFQITISGNAGVFSSFGTPDASSSVWNDAISKNFVKIDDQYWRNITSTDNLTWSGQALTVSYNTSSPNAATGTGWRDCTFTMSADGQTISVGSNTWTRKQ
jgi:hypothetical protein